MTARTAKPKTAAAWKSRGHGETVAVIAGHEAVVFQAADAARQWNVAIDQQILKTKHGRQAWPSREQAQDVAFVQCVKRGEG